MITRLGVLDVARRRLDAGHQLPEPLAALLRQQGGHLMEGRVARAEVVQPPSVTLRQSSPLPREEQLAERPTGLRQAQVEEEPSHVQGIGRAAVLSRAEAPLEVPVLAADPRGVLAVEALLKLEDTLAADLPERAAGRFGSSSPRIGRRSRWRWTRWAA